jgi:Cu2+-exporting ATPase
MALKGISDASARHDLVRTNGQAITRLFVARDGRLIGVFLASNPLRPEAPQVLQRLKELGISDVIMLTGDHEAVAQHIAVQMGIRRYVAGVLPDQKLDCVKSLQAAGHTVAVVGDGINDSPALAQADGGIAVRGGSDVAKETAGTTLLEGDLWKIPEAIEIARQSVQLIEQNWRLIAYPNSMAIALSLLGLIGPIGATVISNGSAVAATLNGLRPLFHRTLHGRSKTT